MRNSDAAVSRRAVLAVGVAGMAAAAGCSTGSGAGSQPAGSAPAGSATAGGARRSARPASAAPGPRSGPAVEVVHGPRTRPEVALTFHGAGDPAIPRTMQDVLQRMVQLQYTSRLMLDKKFFDKIDRVVDLLAKIDQGLPDGSDIRSDPTYREMHGYRTINHFNVVTSSLPAELSNASDFSRSSIEARIYR